MKSLNLTSFRRFFDISQPRGIGLLRENAVHTIAALDKDYLLVFSGQGPARSYRIGESFDMVAQIPEQDSLFLLARSNLQYLHGIDEIDTTLEYAQSELALYDASKQKILRRRVINDCQINAISAWRDESGHVKLAAVFCQFFLKSPTSSLYFHKSTADVMDLEFEVLNVLLLSRSTDEMILTADCNKNHLVLLDDFHQTRFFDLEMGLCYREFLDQNRYLAPLDHKRLPGGIIDLVSEDSFAFHYKEDCYIFNGQGKLITEFGLSGDVSGMLGPRKCLSDASIIVSDKRTLGLAEKNFVLQWLDEDD